LNQTILADSATAAIQNTVDSAVKLLPGLIAAVLVFVLGWVVAFLVSRLFAGLLKLIRLEALLKAHKVEDAFGSVRISDVLTKIVKYYVLLIFIQASVSLVALGTITDYLTSVLLYMPVLIGAVLVVLVAVLFGEYLKEAIIDLNGKSPTVKLAGRGAKLVLIYIGLTMGLATAGFNTMLITGIFMTILQAAAFGLALALGIAFGLGGQEEAKEVIQGARKNLKI
jgi:MFS family permease